MGLEEAFGDDKQLADYFLLLPVPSTRVMQQNPGCQLENLMQKYNSVEIMLANQSLERVDKKQSKVVVAEDKRREKISASVVNSTPREARPPTSPMANTSAALFMQESDSVKVGHSPLIILTHSFMIF